MHRIYTAMRFDILAHTILYGCVHTISKRINLFSHFIIKPERHTCMSASFQKIQGVHKHTHTKHGHEQICLLFISTPSVTSFPFPFLCSIFLPLPIIELKQVSDAAKMQQTENQKTQNKWTSPFEVMDDETANKNGIK